MTMATRLQHPFMMAGFMILLTPCNAEDTVPAIHYLMNEGPGGELRNGTGKTLAGTVAAAAWASGAQRSVLLLDGRKTFATVDGGEGLTFPGGHTADLWFWPDRPIQGGPFGLAVKSSTFRILVTPVVDKLKFLIDLTSGAGKGRVYESFEADGDEQQWHHIALTYSQDTQTTRFHLNGEVIFEKQQDIGKLGHGKTPIRIGLGINTDQTRYFKGMMAGFRLWQRALTHEEIQEMVKKERPKVAGAYRKPGALRPKKATARPINVGDRKQLFIDDRFIEVSRQENVKALASLLGRNGVRKTDLEAGESERFREIGRRHRELAATGSGETGPFYSRELLDRFESVLKGSAPAPATPSKDDPSR